VIFGLKFCGSWWMGGVLVRNLQIKLFGRWWVLLSPTLEEDGLSGAET